MICVPTRGCSCVNNTFEIALHTTVDAFLMKVTKPHSQYLASIAILMNALPELLLLDLALQHGAGLRLHLHAAPHVM